MKRSEVMALLEEQKDERGLKHWAAMGEHETGGLESFGIGLTKLRKIAKQVGRDHELALELWATDNYDAKVVGLLVDDPKAITREQAEEQVAALGGGMLCHVFSSCDATLPKTPFAPALARGWIDSGTPTKRQCGYGLAYELSKNNRNKDLTDGYFMEFIDRIRGTIATESNGVRLAMGGALIGIGKRNKKLNRAALAVARPVNPIDYGGRNACEPLDVVKHLTSDHLKKKLGGG